MSQDIASALATAKFNEILQVTVTPTAEEQTADGDDISSREIVLAARLDRENGGVKWEDVAAAAASTEDDPIARHLRTKIWMFPMLNDTHRNLLYEQAIQRAAQDVVRTCENTTSTIQSLDIGSGTGLLAMMSAKHLRQACQEANSERTIKVTSVEMSTPMACLAKRTIAANGFSSNSSQTESDKSCSVSVNVMEGHSCEMSALSEPKAMLCTSELLESGLLGEGWLVAMRDAWERHLDPKAIVVPQRARVFAQVVEGVSNYWGPQHTLGGFRNADNGLRLFTSADDTATLSHGSDGQHTASNGVIVPVHIENLLADPHCAVRCLSDPMEVMDFNFTRKENIPGPEGRSFTKGFVAAASGTAEGVLFWWELDLYDDLTYSTNDKEASRWQDHWHQCLYVFPNLQKDCVVLENGVSSNLVASHTDMRLDFRIHGKGDVESESKRLKNTMMELEPIVNPQRCWELNNVERLQIIQNSIRHALQRIGNDNGNVLDVSDFSLCGMMASLLGSHHVTSVESSSSQLPMASARVAQIANRLPRNDQNFQIVQCHPEQLTCALLGSDKPANLVLAEPYFDVLEENHCVEEAFNFFYLVRMLKRNEVVSSDALCVPTSARVLACGIECPDIFKAYRKCPNDCVGGFDHKAVTKYWSFDQHPLSLPLCQYEFRRVTKTVTVASLDYATTTEERREEVASACMEKESVCHAIAFWVDYQMTNNSEESSLDTFDSRWRYKQQVLILPEPMVGKEGTPLMIPAKWLTEI